MSNEKLHGQWPEEKGKATDSSQPEVPSIDTNQTMADRHRSDYEGLQPVWDQGLHPTHMYRRELDSGEKMSGSTAIETMSPESLYSQPPQTAYYQSMNALAGGGPGLAASGTGHSGYPNNQDQGMYREHTMGALPPLPEKKRIMGFRRPTFWLSLSNVVLVIAIIIAAVVPATTRHNAVCPSGGQAEGRNASGATSSAKLPDNPQICFNTTSPLAPGTALGLPQVECPVAAAEAQYTVPNTNLTFLRSCNTDYAGSDMGRFPVRSMLDCIALCAQLNLYPSSVAGRCQGVTWVYGDGPQGVGVSFCFPKNDTSKRNNRQNTESAVLLT